MHSYLDGNYLPNEKLTISILDLGFIRGLTAYEFVRIYNGKCFDLQTHLERFLYSIEMQSLSPPQEDIPAICHHLIEENGMREGTLRFYRTPGIEGEGRLAIIAGTVPTFPKSTMALLTAPNFRCYPLVKSTYYAPALIEQGRAKQHGCDDIIFVDKDGALLELSFANFFAIKGQQLLTPAEGILPGVTRKHVLQLAHKLGFIPICRTIHLDEIPSMDEVFATNTTREIVPITQIDDVNFTTHTKTIELRKALRFHIQEITSRCHSSSIGV